MARLFVPGCKVKRVFPESSVKLADYLINNGHADVVTGCCRENEHAGISAADTAICVCNNCRAMLREDSAAEKVISVWEVIDADNDFEYPNYEGIEMALQDCWRAYDDSQVQDAVRSILKKMNVKVYELPDAREKSRSCGMSTMMPCPPQDAGFAPKRYVQDAEAQGMFIAHTEEECAQAMKDKYADVPMEDVACYCVGCYVGIHAGGRRPRGLIDLVFA